MLLIEFDGVSCCRMFRLYEHSFPGIVFTTPNLNAYYISLGVANHIMSRYGGTPFDIIVKYYHFHFRNSHNQPSTIQLLNGTKYFKSKLPIVTCIMVY